ncbi:MAG TPA: GNAT family N-acetyltransferase [Polyangiales bacterium]
MLHTRRLVLRRWRASDREPLARLNADPRVMEHFPSLLSRAESDALFERITAHFDRHGFGYWALDADGAFIGFVGLQHVQFEAAFTPSVEIGWRLAHAAWGQGYASEAARAALHHAFTSLSLREVVSFTALKNLRSRAVMERIGMHEDGEFEHPRLPAGHRLRRHVLYRAHPA